MYVREIAVSFRVMTIEVSQSEEEEEEGDRGGFLVSPLRCELGRLAFVVDLRIQPVRLGQKR